MPIDDAKVSEVLGDLGTQKTRSADEFADARRRVQDAFGVRGTIEEFDLADFLTAAKEVVVTYLAYARDAASTETIHRLRR